jgi:two-component system, NtrC family, response regulator AtoC
MPTKPYVLLVDDDAQWRQTLARGLDKDFAVKAVGGADEARREMLPAPEAVMLDLHLNGAGSGEDRSGIEFLEEIKQEWPEVPVIMVTAFADVEVAVESMRLGAFDFVQKSSGLQEIRLRLNKAIRQRRLARRVVQLERQIETVSPASIIGDGSSMQSIRQAIAAAAGDSSITVLISGESGTGKELVARGIHSTGGRAGEPFVAVVVPTISDSVLESELFGHEKGSFTDAKERRIGLFEQAHGGVLFLDEIGELPLNHQVKLLRFLEERSIRRLGGAAEFPVNVQVVAATNADLQQLVQKGQFRQDLYFRLNVFHVRMPALREHAEDIPALTDYFLHKLARARRVLSFEPEAMQMLLRYPWPGNIRELRNVVESSLLHASLNQHATIEPTDLPLEVTSLAGHEPETGSLAGVLARAELAEVDEALRTSAGNKGQVWQRLGLNDRFALRRRVKRILKDHPELAAEFSSVAAAYGQGPDK